MKKIALVVMTILLCYSHGFAQAAKELKGPMVKNQKVWKDNVKPAVAVFHSFKEKPTGPKAKNQKPWENKRIKQNYLPITSSKRPKLTGPKAKNWKPWMKSNEKIHYVQSSEQKTKHELEIVAKTE